MRLLRADGVAGDGDCSSIAPIRSGNYPSGVRRIGIAFGQIQVQGGRRSTGRQPSADHSRARWTIGRQSANTIVPRTGCGGCTRNERRRTSDGTGCTSSACRTLRTLRAGVARRTSCTLRTRVALRTYGTLRARVALRTLSDSVALRALSANCTLRTRVALRALRASVTGCACRTRRARVALRADRTLRTRVALRALRASVTSSARCALRSGGTLRALRSSNTL